MRLIVSPKPAICGSTAAMKTVSVTTPSSARKMRLCERTKSRNLRSGGVFRSAGALGASGSWPPKTSRPKQSRQSCWSCFVSDPVVIVMGIVDDTRGLRRLGDRGGLSALDVGCAAWPPAAALALDQAFVGHPEELARVGERVALGQGALRGLGAEQPPLEHGHRARGAGHRD